MTLNKDKENIYKLLKYGIILIIIILLLKECKTVINILSDVNKPKRDTVTIHDVDTIYPPPTPIKFKYIEVPKPYIVHDTIISINSKDTCTNVKVYEDSLTDANIDIYYKDYIAQGILLNKEMSYKLKVPIRIIDSVTTTIKVPTLYPPTFQIHGNLTGGSNIFAPGVGVSYKRHTVSVGYNLATKQPILGYSFVLFRK